MIKKELIAEMEEIDGFTNEFYFAPFKRKSAIDFLFTYKEEYFSPIHGIHAIIAPSKTEKTFLATALTCAALKGEYLGVTCNKENAKILFVDLEQSPYATQGVMDRVHHICGWPQDEPNPRFMLINLSEMCPKDRRTFLSNAITSLHFDMIIINGCSNLLDNPNDPKESASLRCDFEEISYEFECAIWFLLPQYQPDIATGMNHFANQIDNNCCDRFLLEDVGVYPNAHFVAKHSSRNDDFGTMQFRIETAFLDNGEKISIPVELTTQPEGNDGCSTEANRKREIWETMQKVVPTGNTIVRDAIVMQLQKNLMTTKAMAEKLITEARSLGVIEYVPNKGYKLLPL